MKWWTTPLTQLKRHFCPVISFLCCSYLLVHLEETDGDVSAELLAWAVGEDAQLRDDHWVQHPEVQANGRDICGGGEGRHLGHAQNCHLLPGHWGETTSVRLRLANAWLVRELASERAGVWKAPLSHTPNSATSMLIWGLDCWQALWMQSKDYKMGVGGWLSSGEIGKEYQDGKDNDIEKCVCACVSGRDKNRGNISHWCKLS